MACEGEVCLLVLPGGFENPVMRKRLQIALMASTLAATSLSLTVPVRAADEGDGSSDKNAEAKAVATKITATDDHGHKVYVNDSVAASPSRHAEAPRSTLKYWSSKENRWKPVPPPNAAIMRAAKSAAAEVNEYIGHDSIQAANAKIATANFRGPLATSGDVDSAIEQAAARITWTPTWCARW